MVVFQHSPLWTAATNSQATSAPLKYSKDPIFSITDYQNYNKTLTMDPPNFRPGLLDRILVSISHFVNLFIPWHKLPSYFGALNLDALRIELRQYNLHDGYASATAQGNTDEDPLDDKRFLSARNSDGTDNSLTMPKMGCSGMRFGRNFPRKYCQKPTEQELWTPNPRLVSEAFMARKPGEFKPAITLNLLAAAWIQFQVHDWVFHEAVSIFYAFLMLYMLICVIRARIRMKCLFSPMMTGMVRWKSSVPNPTKYSMLQTSNVPAIRTPRPHGTYNTFRASTFADSDAQVGWLTNLWLKRSQNQRTKRPTRRRQNPPRDQRC